MNAEDAAKRIAGECLAMRTRRLSRVVTRLFDAALRPLGIGVAQLSLLVAVQRRGPMAPAQVGRALDIEKSTLSRNLARLQESGWIQERPEGRGKLLELTPAGRLLLAKAYPLWRQAQTRARRHLGEAAVSALLDRPG